LNAFTKNLTKNAVPGLGRTEADDLGAGGQ
jgi:hypothetical protein